MADRPGRVDHIVDQYSCPSFHVAHDVHDLGNVRDIVRASLVNDRYVNVEHDGKLARPRDTSDIRRHHNDPPGLQLISKIVLEVIGQQVHARQVIYGDIKEALDLSGVKVGCDHSVDPAVGQNVRDELGRDWLTGLGLAILSRVAEVRYDGIDVMRGVSLRGIGHDQQLHQIFIRRGAGRLKQIDIGSSHALIQRHADLTVGKSVVLDG